MLSLTRKTDYALIALGYLAAQPGRVASAREIADSYRLPLPLLMNVLKTLTQQGLVESLRGTKGGYRLRASLQEVSVYDLVKAMEGSVRLVECNGSTGADCRVSGCPIQSPIRALRERLVGFLSDVKLADLLGTLPVAGTPVGSVAVSQVGVV